MLLPLLLLLALLPGQFRGSSYALVRVAASRVDVLAFGQSKEGWAEDYRALDELPQDCQTALNGTFFSLRFHEPAGILVYGGRRWTPRFRRDGQPVAGFRRCFLALHRDGTASIGNSQGQSVHSVLKRLRPVRALMGGAGRLVRDGRPALDLAAESFDERSGLRPDEPLPRTGVGLDGEGQVLLVTARRLTIPDFADLFVKLGARQAVFLDCGSSTAMKSGGWSTGNGRRVPTWLVVRSGGGESP